MSLALLAAAVKKASSLPKTQTCSEEGCDAQATMRVLWAEGMAYQPACDAHEQAVKDRIEKRNGAGEVVGVKPIPAAKQRVYVRDDDGKFAEVPGLSVDVPDAIPGHPFPGRQRDTDLASRLTHCYSLTYSFVTGEGRGWSLVHGTIQGAGNPPIGHAFALSPDGKWAYEPSSDEVYPTALFEHLFNPTYDHTFEFAEIMTNSLRYGHAGPWDESPEMLGEGAPEDDDDWTDEAAEEAYARILARREALAAAEAEEEAEPPPSLLRGGGVKWDVPDEYLSRTTPEQRATFERMVEEIAAMTGVPNVEVTVVKSVSGGAAMHRVYTDREGVRFHRISVMNASIAQEDMLNGHMSAGNRESGGEVLRFAVTHEFGHAYAEEHGHDLKGRKEIAFWREQSAEGMSAYGRSDRHEAYAEAYAQWMLGQDRDDDFTATARAYAERYDWPDPVGVLRAAKSRGLHLLGLMVKRAAARVQTAAGAEHYDQPIGSVIVPGTEGVSSPSLHVVRGDDPAPPRAFRAPSDDERKALAIPPGWTDVLLAEDYREPGPRLVAKGRDAAGRAQAMYNADHHAAAAKEKYERVQKMLDAVPALDKALARDAGDDTADALLLIRRMGLRPGSVSDTKAKVQAYGATTLLREHVVKDGDSVRLQFTGKKGVKIDLPVEDLDVAAMLLRRTKKGKGDEPLFPTASAVKARDYMIRALGTDEYTPKDLRTMLGTAVALKAIEGMPIPTTEREFRKARLDVGKRVAAVLGNRPAQALESYISPAVFSRWHLEGIAA